MSGLEERLSRGRAGRAILFCGAGLTADCLNFEDAEPLGVTHQLLKLFNDTLAIHGRTHGYKDIRNAAKAFKKELGGLRLMTVMQERFKLSKVSAAIADIVRYPWECIYTTNYDNGLELALQSARKKFSSVNNLASPDDPFTGVPVVHLHGSATDWSDLRSFENSCVLDSESYYRLAEVKRWLDKLRFDVERAEVVVFVGFSAADFHLNQVFFDVAGLKDKAFFINRPTAAIDPDTHSVQEDFGTPSYVGRDEFASKLVKVCALDAPKQPSLASFQQITPPPPSPSVPPVADIEDLFIWGRINFNHLKRDIDQGRSDYHVMRHDVPNLAESLSYSGRIALVRGDICDGKSLVIADTMMALSSARPIFNLRHTYEDIVSEVTNILAFHPNALFVIENCLSIREDRLMGVVLQIAASKASILLSARNISTEAESAKIGKLRGISSFEEFEVGRMNASEIDALIVLIDQIAGWREFPALTLSDRRRYIENNCRSNLPSVLIHLLKSKYVRDKYREEFNKLSHVGRDEMRLVIAALLISSLGFDPQHAFLSNIFQTDFTSAMNRVDGNNDGLRLLRVEGALVKTLPSIGARNLLEAVISDHEIVNTTIYILEQMTKRSRRTDFEVHIFQQLMRYSNLVAWVANTSEINRFFDHISKIGEYRDLPLFWLQWHMAMTAQREWSNAEKYLEMGFTAASAYEKKRNISYDRRQLDDRRAKFLAARARGMQRTGAVLFRDLREGLEITQRLFQRQEVSKHPYETLFDLSEAFEAGADTLVEVQRNLLTTLIQTTAEKAEKRLGSVPDGHQRSKATEALKAVRSHGVKA